MGFEFEVVVPGICIFSTCFGCGGGCHRPCVTWAAEIASFGFESCVKGWLGGFCLLREAGFVPGLGLEGIEPGAFWSGLEGGVVGVRDGWEDPLGWVWDLAMVF